MCTFVFSSSNVSGLTVYDQVMRVWALYWSYQARTLGKSLRFGVTASPRGHTRSFIIVHFTKLLDQIGEILRTVEGRSDPRYSLSVLHNAV